MSVALATNVVLILWLVIATTYWKSSQCVTSHPWECFLHTCFEKELTFKSIAWYDLHNVHLCLNNKGKHYLNHSSNKYRGTKNLCYTPFRMYVKYSFFFRMHENHFSLQTNHHIGPPIKWWEDNGCEGQRSNPSINTITKLKHTYSKKFTYDVLYSFSNMAETSSTKNMDVCVVEENEIMTNS